MKDKSILALSIAFASFALFCPRPAGARSANTTPDFSNKVPAAVASREAAKMVPAEAVLAQSLDANSIRTGEQFQAKLSDTVHLKDGVKLPKGTALIGTVATDRMRADGTSRLALRFTKAQLKDGKVVPIEATIIGVAPPEYGSAWDGSDGQAPPDQWNGKVLQVDEIGAISGFDLHSSIAGTDSGVFVSAKKDNVKLSDNTQISLAIAPRGRNQMNGGA